MHAEKLVSLWPVAKFSISIKSLETGASYQKCDYIEKFDRNEKCPVSMPSVFMYICSVAF